MAEVEPEPSPVPRKTLQRIVIGAVVALAVLALLGAPAAFLVYLAVTPGHGTAPTPAASSSTAR